MVVETHATPMMRPTPNKRGHMKKATSLFDDTPNKFGFGHANTTIGGMSNMSRTNKLSVNQIEDFVSHTQSVSQVLQSKNIRELMTNIVIAMKRVFKVSKVNFMLQCKETIDLLHTEGAQVKQMSHCHQTFYVLMPDNVKKEDFDFNFCFKNMADVMKGKVFSGRFCAAPVFKL